MSHRIFKVVRERHRFANPCYVVREQRLIDRQVVWDWLCWSRTLADAESTARGLGQLHPDSLTTADETS